MLDADLAYQVEFLDRQIDREVVDADLLLLTDKQEQGAEIEEIAAAGLSADIQYSAGVQ